MELLCSSGEDTRAQFGHVITTLAHRKKNRTDMISVRSQQNMQASRASPVISPVMIRPAP
jgi:hypothetical protein